MAADGSLLSYLCNGLSSRAVQYMDLGFFRVKEFKSKLILMIGPNLCSPKFKMAAQKSLKSYLCNGLTNRTVQYADLGFFWDEDFKFMFILMI